MTPASFHQSYILSGDDHFTSLAHERRARIQRRYRYGPDVEAALLMAVAAVGPRDVLEVGAGAGALAAQISKHVGARVVAADTNAALTADAHARGVHAVVADVGALPFYRATLGCVVADRVLYHGRDVVEGLREICRVLRSDGALVAVVRSGSRNGHELDALLHLERRGPADALNAENGRAVLSRHFRHIDEQNLDYVLDFPDGEAAAGYAATLPGRASLAHRIAEIEHSIQLTFGMTLFTAEEPLAA
jgi:SAM-dependent methyltransferase